MSDATLRRIGTVSTDGNFEWDGAGWVPRGSRRASTWTRPLQVSASFYFLLLAVSNLVVNFVLGGTSAGRLRALYAQSGLSAGQAASVAQTMAGVVLAFTAALALVYALLAFASWRGWRWAFWVDAVALLPTAFGAFANLRSLLRPDGTTMPPAALAVSEAVSALGIVLLCTFVVSLVRFGFAPWAAKPR